MSRDLVDGAALFAALLLCFMYAFPRWADWNQNSRFDLVVAIVDHGTLSIDCCVDNTGDYAEFEGRTYSDKAPGLSFLAVPVYAVFEVLTRLPPIEASLLRLSQGEALKGTLRETGTGLLLDKIRFFLGLVMSTLLVVAVPSALACVALFFFLRRWTEGRGARLAVTAAYALGSIAFPYSGNFYAHQLAAALLFAAFVLVSRESRRWTRAEIAATGLLLGWAVICEYPAALIAGAIGAMFAARLAPKRDLLWAALAASLPLLLCAGYNFAIFGTPLPVGYRYSALWQSRHAEGFVSLTYPRLPALWGLTFGPFRGLFLLSPVLLLAIPGVLRIWRSGRMRVELAVSVWAVLSFLAFNASSAMWWGGFAVGPRYLVPMLPFLAWPMVAAIDRPGATRIAFAVTFALSLVLVGGLTWAEQQFPPDTIAFPWRDWAWPHLSSGNLARNAGMVVGLRGWRSLLPLLGGLAAIAALWLWTERRT